MRREPTEAQRAAAAERRAAMRKLAKRVSAMTSDERNAIAARLGVVTIEGRSLSPFNSCMVWCQNPTASVVGGFRQWIRAGRAVCKGEHGMAIWVPTIRTRKAPDSSPEVPDADSIGFVLGTVFDVTQTQEIETGAAAESAVAA